MKRKNGSHQDLPEAFTQRLQSMWGEQISKQICKTFVPRPVTFRVNTLRGEQPIILESLKQFKLTLRAVPWFKKAFVAIDATERVVNKTDSYANGQIYLQSLASMLPVLALDPKPGDSCLDLTAAPGGKTSQIADATNCVGMLVANEANPIRMQRLRHNMQLLGIPEGYIALVEGDGAALCAERHDQFDKILLDAPCGAESRFIAGDIRTFGFWNEAKIKNNAYQQRRLLLSAWQALKPGGTLVYSTCTLAPEENELQIDRLLERHGDEAEILEAGIPGVKRLPAVLEWRGKKLNPSLAKTLRVFPTDEIESFYMAKIRKLKRT